MDFSDFTRAFQDCEQRAAATGTGSFSDASSLDEEALARFYLSPREFEAWQAWHAFRHTPVSISFGDSAYGNFKNDTLEAHQLVALLGQPHRRRANKDGPAICGGALWSDADAPRGKKNLADKGISAVSIVIFEVDSGQTVQNATAELVSRGINHLVTSTFSNGATNRDVDHDALLTHMKGRDSSNAAPTAEDVTAYLLEKGRVTAELAHSVTGDVKLGKDKNGRPAWEFKTAPCPKYRIYIFLETPFPIFRPGHIGRDDKLFTEFYHALADDLDILHDRMCGNVARAQYLPSVRHDGPEPFSYFTPGHPYDWRELADAVRDSVEEGSTKRKKQRPPHQNSKSRTKASDFKTANLFRFGVTCSAVFDVENFAAGILDDRGSSNSGGICLVCPNEYGDVSGRPHTDPGGTAFWVCNGWNRTDGGDGFIIHCSTEGCKAHFEGDRLRFLDELCQFAAIEDAEKLLEYTNDASKAREAYDAWDRFQTTPEGRPHPSQYNIRVALRREGISLSFNEFDGKTYVEGLEGFGPYLDDDAVNRIWLTIDREYRFRPTKDFFYTVLRDEARLNTIHPVRDYLDRVQPEWDGIERVDGWLSSHLGAEDSPLNRAIGRIWLVAAVRRIRSPGCKFDEMIVLESAQGKGKSTALAILAVKDDWYTDSLSLSASPKVTIEQTRGKWIVEVPELLGGRKSEIEQVKAFLSRRVDESRMSYDRATTNVPRAFVCGSTTNQEQYLRDPTGNRRFWGVAVAVTGDIDLPKLTVDRDQLWAEAATMEANEESIRLPQELWALAATVQEARHVENPYESVLAEKLDAMEGKIKAVNVYDLTEVGVVQRHTGFFDLVAGAMKTLGWTKKAKIRFGKATLAGFRKGTGEDADLQTIVVTWDNEKRGHFVIGGGNPQPPSGGLRDRCS